MLPEIPKSFISLEIEQLDPSRDRDRIANRMESVMIPDAPYETLDDFIDRTKIVFGLVTFYWESLEKTVEKLSEITKNVYAIPNPIANGNRIIFGRLPDDATKAMRELASQQEKQVIPGILHRVRRDISEEKVINIAQAMMEKRSLSVEDVAGMAMSEWKTQQKKNVASSLIAPESQSISDQVTGAKNDIIGCFYLAFAAQHIAIGHIEKLLANEANIMPFVEYLSEVATFRTRGYDECPALLETVNVLVTQSDNFEQAVLRVAKATQSPEDFVSRVLFDPSSNTRGVMPKDFQAIVLGAKLAHDAIQYDEPSIAKTMAGAISRHLIDGNTQNPWKTAYETDATAGARAVWRNLQDKLRGFAQRGRVPVKASEEISKPVIPGQGRKRAGKVKPPTNASLDTRDLFTSALPSVRDLRLGIMTNIEGSSRHRVTPLPNLEALKECSIITRFFEDQKATEGYMNAVYSSLEYLFEYPQGANTKRLILTYSVDSPDFPQRQYNLRRFKFASQLLEEPSDERSSGIRIFYGIVPDREKELHLLLQGIVQRDDDTYSRLSRQFK